MANITLAQIRDGMIEVQSSAPSVVCAPVAGTTEVVQVCPPTNSVTIDPSRINGGGNDFYEGTFTNGTDETQNLIFGLNLGIGGAYSSFGTVPSGVDFAAFQETSRGAAYANNAMSVWGANKRWGAHGIIASSIEIQTDNAAQARQRISVLKMNNNLEITSTSRKPPFCDECGNSAQSTVFTTRFDGPYAIDVNNGISYPILSEVAALEFRINISGMDLAGNYVEFANVC